VFTSFNFVPGYQQQGSYIEVQGRLFHMTIIPWRECSGFLRSVGR